MNVLRKVCENDMGKWPDQLPYVKYAYNTKLHATTSFRPDEINESGQKTK